MQTLAVRLPAVFAGVLTVLALAGEARAACTVNLTAPADGTTQVQTPTFSWTGDCSRYRVWFSPSGTFGADRVLTSFQTQRTYRMSEATWDSYQQGAWAGGVYWKVQGRAADATLSFSSTRLLLMDPDIDDDGRSVGAGADCNDADPTAYPGAPEVCDGVDDDCDGAVDDGLVFSTWYPDLDGDGYGATDLAVQTCDGAPAGYVAQGGDCDETDATANPGAAEVCNGVDDDCDGAADDGLAFADSYPDADGDGYGAADLAVSTCDGPPAGYVGLSGDCDEGDATVNPAAEETCDGVDNDCDGAADDGLTFITWYADADGDNYGTESLSFTSCDDALVGYVDVAGDCDEGDEYIHPGADELCDGVDDDCDGVADDGLTYTDFYPDPDGDGYGVTARKVTSCDAAIPGHATLGGDCDEGDPANNPGATEVCDGVDDDCDGQVDEGFDSVAYYLDFDGDGVGHSGFAVQTCDGPPAGYVAEGGDCDEGDPSVYPSAPEVCDGVDNDCDGEADEDTPYVDYYLDFDRDGYGSDGFYFQSCDGAPFGYVTLGGDCDEGDASVNPGAIEACGDAEDQDCDGETEDCGPSAGELVVSEVMQNPDAVSDADGEWFEVYNAGDHPVDVRDVTFSDLGGESFTVAGSLTVPVGGFLVFARDGDAGVNGGVTADYAYGDGFTLGNGDDELVIETTGGQVLVDALAYDGRGEPAGGFPDPLGASMSLDPGILDASLNDDASAWCASVSAFGLGDLGTPGATNDSCDVEAVDDDLDGWSTPEDCDDGDPLVNPGAGEVCDDGLDNDCDGATDESCSASPAPGDLVISEIFQDTAFRAHLNAEWFEVYNLAPITLDLGGVTVTDGASETFTIAGPLAVPSGTAAVLARSGDLSVNGGIYPDFVYGTAFSLDDVSDAVRLVGTDGATLLDAVAYDDATFPDVGGRSLTLDWTAYDPDANDGGASWCAGSSEFGTLGYLGTPGGDNDSCDPADADADRDGYSAAEDCDDLDPAIHPAALDDCDGVDNDCDGVVDPGCAAPPAPGDLVITEVMNNPDAVADADGEWFEVYNASASTLDVSGAMFSDDGGEAFTVDAYLTVEPGAFLVFARDGDPGVNGGVDADYAYGDGFVLGNADDEVALWSAASELLDEVAYDGLGQVAGGFPDPLGASISLDPGVSDPSANDFGAAWCAATTPYGDGDLGTPGAANDSCDRDPVDADGDTWLSDVDCDDGDPTIHPGASEVCDDGVDNDCSGEADDGCSFAPAYGDLVISEIFQDTVLRAHLTAEWFELYNLSGVTLDLDGVQVTDGGTESFTVDGPLAVPAGTAVVFARSGDVTANGGLTPDYVYGTAFSLDDAADAVKVFAAEGALLDDVSYSDEAFPDVGGRSLTLDWNAYDPADNDDGASWCAGYSVYGDLGYRGTPGGDNDSCDPADADTDGDGYAFADDCDDLDPAVHPDAADVCDGIADNDCDGLADPSEADADADGWSTCDGDCDDADPTSFPGGAEVCDGADNDCDGEADEGLVEATYYADGDGDGYGDADSPTDACGGPPAGYVADATDCDDAEPLANPGLTEVCGDGVDNDCDGTRNGCGLAGAVGLSAADAERDGPVANDNAGNAVATGCDVDGDGVDDVVVGALGDDAAGTGAGAAYLVLGPVTGNAGIAPTAAAKLTGEAAGHQAGNAVACAGDIDGDGFGDLVIGARNEATNGTQAGAAYIVYGPVTGTVSLSTADAKLLGSNGSHAGYAVASAGDVNGDGFGDIVVGARLEGTGGSEAGAAYIVYGPVTGTHQLVDSDVVLIGEASTDRAGTSVAGGADVNGDGFDDVIVGAPQASSAAADSGVAYVVYGSATLGGTIDLADADVLLSGELTLDHAGHSVALVPDMDGDGYDEVVVGAYDTDDNGTASGSTYVLNGAPGLGGTLNLGSADAEVVGGEAGDQVGYAVSSAGDFDGDGFVDLLVGAQGSNAGGNDSGAAYLLYGPLVGTVAAASGVTFVGEAATDNAGYSVAGGSDLDGDGLDDAVVGAYRNDSLVLNGGAIYVVLGVASY